jgi:hypothetical protein
VSYLQPRRSPLGGVASRVHGTTYTERPVSIIRVPLGDVEPPAADMTEAEWRQRMLTEQARIGAAAAKWVEQDRQIRYMQIAATLMIPVAGAVWKFILGRRAVSRSLSL